MLLEMKLVISFPAGMVGEGTAAARPEAAGGSQGSWTTWIPGKESSLPPWGWLGVYLDTSSLSWHIGTVGFLMQKVAFQSHLSVSHLDEFFLFPSD